ncbi:hypothetical protein EKD00_07740 [Chlorobium phaeovibrioides]|uniref:VanZ-like domain-containing protein n=1 Tax=Chlorobium phaeovibrioides TaxID=1094 RepID=A0A3S0NA86_CHLPH|nr:hypothetical protein [Chlorobium phaeovibrioides]QEQ57664.1 hypothetical protein FNV82_09180 [Chlorobium phaeovibrioides]RTY34666.1 hypothetical protein EKD00_07740 [Chlorobium phaeovibrioides]RTY37768.1 hypothetical protein EKD02_06490 [Chlorobium phaeovibrioides]
MSTKNKLKTAWLAAFILLLTASFSPGTDSSRVFGLDIVFHLGIYAILAAAPLIALKKRLTAFLVALAIAPLGLLFETMHGSTTGYGFKMMDAFYNNLGITVGMITGIMVRLKHHYEK